MDASQVADEAVASGASSSTAPIEEIPKGALSKVAPALQRVKGLVKSASLRGKQAENCRRSVSTFTNFTFVELSVLTLQGFRYH